MPIPSPEGEPKKNFLSKCMGDSVMTKEFPDEKQRYAVCQSKWKKSKGTEHPIHQGGIAPHPQTGIALPVLEIDFTDQIIAANLHGVSKRGKGWKK